MRLPWWLPFGAVPELSAPALRAALARTPAPQLLDVRTAGEFARGHIAGAVNVPITALRERLAAGAHDLDRQREVIAICLSAHRSPPAVRLLRDRGFDARQLAGGMLAWRAAGLPESS
jgi:rhodanese-related sulfurtransferase